MTGPLALDNSGSLTGHILAQGRPDTAEARSGGSKAVIVTLVVTSILVVAGLVTAIMVLSGKG
jgi:uncharacterized membrane protein YccC